ncbi:MULTISPECIES: RebB family R body protein [Marinomonas]|uniref:RebB family R body protein n=1 Tax=Marinomonas TaxID=28253 RepID=UPI0007AF206E|nr:RebB family R body protein [Marinomonas sp. TW1]KZN13033.1 hypothetical protein OA79_12840 [Marinomonas sp. TW1]
MPIDIEKLLTEWSPVSSRNMYLNMVADSLAKASQNATHVQQQIQTITVTNTALGSGLIYAIAAQGSKE